MLSRPLVTIGIPNYNYGHYVLETIESVISQSYDNIELIIVDDCSSDDSKTVIENWIENYNGPKVVKLISNSENIGLTRVCNIILKEAKGKYFQTLDADDIISQDKITHQVKVLEVSGAAVAYSNLKVIDEHGSIIHENYLNFIGYNENEMPSGLVFSNLFKFNFVPLPSVLINTAKARSVGGFDETLQVQDYYMWLKLAEHNSIIYMNEFTGCYRIHNRSMSNSNVSNSASVESVLKIKHAYYDRMNEGVRKIIRSELNASSVYLYQQNSKSALFWLRKAYFLNPGVKTLGYYLAGAAHIPFSFVSKVKSLLLKVKT